MATGENFLTQLKGVVDPMTIFSHYISLKKAGARYRALCPFHNEKTPSFYASENGMFHCFGCGAGGDVIKFVMMMEHFDFKDCVQMLSQRYGIPLKFSSTGERKEKEELLDLMRKAADYYHNLLTTHESGQEALDYLEQRGVTRETIRRFQIGWAPASWSSLLDHFHKRDVSPSLLEKCGLVVPRQQEGHYDRYRSRIMIPIHDLQGNVIALGGRIFKGTGEEAKYMNSPETTIYSKSNHLFGLYFSKDAVQAKKSALMVEGYFDMILPFQAGHTNIVASLGTALTENQARLLRRYAEEVVLFYDPDTAGRSAVVRALPILLKENFVVRVGILPEGLDPDKYIRERGAEAFQGEIDQALRYNRFFLKMLEQKHDLNSPNGRMAASEEMIDLLNTIGNPFEYELVLKDFAHTVGISRNVLQDRSRKKHKGSVPALQSPVAEMSKKDDPEIQLLQILIVNPALGPTVFSELQAPDMEGLARADIFRQLQQLIGEEHALSSAEIIHAFSDEHKLQSQLASLTLDVELPAASMENARDKIRALQVLRDERRLARLNLEIEEAVKAHDEEALGRLLTHKQELGRELRGRKMEGSG